MMRLPSLQWAAPRTLTELTTRLAADPASTKLLAGGTDLIPNLKRRHQHARQLLWIGKIPELQGIQPAASGEVSLGASTTLTAITRNDHLRRHYPGLVRAVASISSPVLRNMGTIGGNLCLDTRCTYYNQSEEWRRSIDYCLKEAGDTCWVAPGSPRCWAISASDSAPLLAAIGAKVSLHSVAGEREIDVERLFVDDGIQYLAKRPDEVLTRIRLPAVSRSRSTYWKLRRRHSIDFPVLGVGAMVASDGGGRITAARVFLGAVASAPLSVDTSALLGQLPTEELVHTVAERARDLATPLDNTDFTLQWRRRMVHSYVDGALRELCGLPAKVVAPREGRFAIEV